MKRSLKWHYQDKFKTYEKFKKFLYEVYKLIYLLLAEIIPFISVLYQSFTTMAQAITLQRLIDLNYLHKDNSID